jgi:hypothetical protein
MLKAIRHKALATNLLSMVLLGRLIGILLSGFEVEELMNLL